MYRYGIVSLLAGIGHQAEAPADVLDWARRHRHATVLLTVDAEADWTTLTALADIGRSHLVVAMLTAPTDAGGAAAVRAGAVSVVDRSASPERLLHLVTGLVSGDVTLPLGVLRRLASEPDDPADDDRPPPEQLAWLRTLAGGSTVAALANQVGYSERAMFRLLQGLYRRLGVRSRTEALIHANERGWLRG
ncbi:helix-turn-helix domain-containing protein [Actinoplanes sp. RD1]|uniref:DNA-binding response regulator n=1 Tax=Actinoplanes sp. RD1 TaxID=3064538 RepID=UPI00274104BE|nr:DNA-binding response regulator [Actinoplanes sp. RD1]